MFNWYTAPTFAASLLFWLLAAYVLTRSRRDATTVAAVVALAATSSYLLGEAMEANAPSIEAWRAWARPLRWGAPLAPAAWYWLTALFLREQDTPVVRRYLRAVGYPLGVVLIGSSLLFTAAVYQGDLLWQWSVPPHEVTDGSAYMRYVAPTGDLYWAFLLSIVVTAVGVTTNLALAWRSSSGDDRHARFTLLLASLALFAPEVGSLVAYHWTGYALPTWLNHLSLAVAMALMATSVSAYHHLRHGQTIRADLIYFVATWAVLCAAFVPVFLLVGGGYSYQNLGLLVVTVAMVILAHALAEPVRRGLDRLFFGSEVQRLRSSLTTVVQDAAITEDQHLGALLSQAQTELQEVSEEYVARLTQEALRRLNAPGSLAGCALAERLPNTLALIRQRDAEAADPAVAADAAPSPLEQARALRTALVQAVDRLRPADERDQGAPAALQFHILHDAYVLGQPNKQIMVRRGISESTFHRNRREAVMVLARDLMRQEARLLAK